MRFSNLSPTGVVCTPFTPRRGLVPSRSKKSRSGLFRRSERKRNSPLVSMAMRVTSERVQKRTAVTSSCCAGHTPTPDASSRIEIGIRRMIGLARSEVLSPFGIHGFLDYASADFRFFFWTLSLGLFLGGSRLPQLLAYLVHIVSRLGVRRDTLVFGHGAFPGVVSGQGQPLVATVELHEVLQVANPALDVLRGVERVADSEALSRAGDQLHQPHCARGRNGVRVVVAFHANHGIDQRRLHIVTA